MDRAEWKGEGGLKSQIENEEKEGMGRGARRREGGLTSQIENLREGTTHLHSHARAPTHPLTLSSPTHLLTHAGSLTIALASPRTHPLTRTPHPRSHTMSSAPPPLSHPFRSVDQQMRRKRPLVHAPPEDCDLARTLPEPDQGHPLSQREPRGIGALRVTGGSPGAPSASGSWTTTTSAIGTTITGTATRATRTSFFRRSARLTTWPFGTHGGFSRTGPLVHESAHFDVADAGAPLKQAGMSSRISGMGTWATGVLGMTDVASCIAFTFAFVLSRAWAASACRRKAEYIAPWRIAPRVALILQRAGERGSPFVTAVVSVDARRAAALPDVLHGVARHAASRRAAARAAEGARLERRAPQGRGRGAEARQQTQSH